MRTFSFSRKITGDNTTNQQCYSQDCQILHSSAWQLARILLNALSFKENLYRHILAECAQELKCPPILSPLPSCPPSSYFLISLTPQSIHAKQAGYIQFLLQISQLHSVCVCVLEQAELIYGKSLFWRAGAGINREAACVTFGIMVMLLLLRI